MAPAFRKVAPSYQISHKQAGIWRPIDELDAVALLSIFTVGFKDGIKMFRATLGNKECGAILASLIAVGIFSKGLRFNSYESFRPAVTRREHCPLNCARSIILEILVPA